MGQSSVLEPGLMIFIKKKMENAVPPATILDMLRKAGFSEDQIKLAFEEVKMTAPTEFHQDLAAANNFMPTLQKTTSKTDSLPIAPSRTPAKIITPATGPGIFKGRLHRRDLILGFLFFFGLCAVMLSVEATLVQIFFPSVFYSTLEFISADTIGLPLLFAPIVTLPFVIAILALLARRLHDINMSGWLALGFLVFFVPAGNIFSLWGIMALQGMMGIVFILLLLKGGSAGSNRFGPRVPMTGSAFVRILNLY